MSEVAVAVFVVSRRGRIEDVDDAACALLGYSREELLALHGSELVLPDDRPKVAVSLDGMSRGTIASRPGRLVRKDGSVVSVLVRSRPLGEDRIALQVSPERAAATH